MNEALWRTEFDTPMPEGTTYKDFRTARNKKWLGDSIRFQNMLLGILEDAYKVKGNEGILDIIDYEQSVLYGLIERRTNMELTMEGGDE